MINRTVFLLSAIENHLGSLISAAEPGAEVPIREEVLQGMRLNVRAAMDAVREWQEKSM